MVQERSVSEATAGQFWMWMGVLSLLSGPLFGTLTALDQDVEISVRPASSGRAGQIHLKTHETA